MELGSVYQRLGSVVEVIEYADKVIPSFDNEVSAEFLKILKKKGIHFRLQQKVVGGHSTANSVVLVVEDIKVKIFLC